MCLPVGDAGGVGDPRDIWVEIGEESMRDMRREGIRMVSLI